MGKTYCIELDLFFQIWLSSLKIDIKVYSIKILYEAYLDNLSSEEFYYKYVYLPF